MNRTIEVQVKEHYGSGYIYVVSEHQEYISQLTGKKTVSMNDLKCLVKLGFEIIELKGGDLSERIAESQNR